VSLLRSFRGKLLTSCTASSNLNLVNADSGKWSGNSMLLRPGHGLPRKESPCWYFLAIGVRLWATVADRWLPHATRKSGTRPSLV
jgi:hypothetical protein